MPTHSLIAELERSLSSGSEAQRSEMLSRITDLFVADSANYTAEQISLFDDLLTKFAAVIEAEARAKLSNRLADVANAPAGVIRTLALDDDIEVARPVLRDSARLGEHDLVASANGKSQQHLLAISQRKALSEAVTDVLVTRGSPEVAQSVAKNETARFSFAGFRDLVRRSHNDDSLAAIVGTRSDLPRTQLLRLLETASAKVRAQLSQQNPDSKGAVQTAVDEVDSGIRLEIGECLFNYAPARPGVESLHRLGKLNEAAVAQYAREQKFEETVIGLSLLCEVHLNVVERALLAPGTEILLILAKLAGFSWPTVTLLLRLKIANRALSQRDLDEALSHFNRLNTGTARRVLGFYRLRSDSVPAA